MKYELETIPVWDAYHAQSECPLCLLLRKAEQDFVRFYVGHSVMVPEMRVQVNDTGFCPAHFPMLLEGGNRLGLALITHTHVGELRRKLERRLGSGKAGAALKREIAGFGTFLTEQIERCLICERLDDPEAHRRRRQALQLHHRAPVAARGRVPAGLQRFPRHLSGSRAGPAGDGRGPRSPDAGGPQHGGGQIAPGRAAARVRR